MEKAKLCTVLGAFGSFIASLFGGWDTGLATLMIFMVADYIMGLVVAGVFHNSPKTDSGKLESKTGWKGLCRKCVTLLFVLVAYRLDITLGVDYIRDAVIIGFGQRAYINRGKCRIDGSTFTKSNKKCN